MLTVDGADHRRMRTLVAQALTPRRVEQMRERITKLTEGWLDALVCRARAGSLSPRPSCPPPPDVTRRRPHGHRGVPAPPPQGTLREVLLDETPPAEVIATLDGAGRDHGGHGRRERAEPGDDLTSALILASEDGDHLTDEEIVSTLQLMVAAGHETTISLIVNAVVNLSAHPEQRALVLSGEADWSAVVEETLRYSTPTSHVLDLLRDGGRARRGQGDPRGRRADRLVRRDRPRRDPPHGPTAATSTSPAPPRTVTSPSATAPTSVPAPRSPAWRRPSPSRPCTPVSRPWTWRSPPRMLRNKPVVTQNDLHDLPVRLTPTPDPAPHSLAPPPLPAPFPRGSAPSPPPETPPPP